MMDADDYQERAMRTAGEALGDRDGLLIGVLGLCGEAGEVADLVKKHLGQGHPLDHGRLREEAGDVAWYLARLCKAMGWSLGGVLRGNLDKLHERYPAGFDPARSRNRAGGGE